MDRFESKVLKTGSCWIWQGAIRGKSGYGAIKVNGKVVSTHRYSYNKYKGEIPDWLYVCHICDNRLCVNPDHLFLGSAYTNVMDSINKGRFNDINQNRYQYEQFHKPKNRLLTDEEVVKLKIAILTKTVPLKQLALELGYPYQLLRDISSNRTYKNVAIPSTSTHSDA